MEYNSLKNLVGCRLSAGDGDAGSVSDFYFDDEAWHIRYLVADTGNWLTGRKVLLAPQAVSGIDFEKREIGLGLSPDTIADAPSVETDLPVSRRKEAEMLAHYGWTPYWGAALPEAGVAMSAFAGAAGEGRRDIMQLERDGDPHLRSVNEVIGYHVACQDGDIGRVTDMVVPRGDWVIRYLVVDTGDWLPGRQVILAPEWFGRIDWEARSIRTALTRDSVEQSAAFESIELLDRKYEEDLYAHYSVIPYW